MTILSKAEIEQLFVGHWPHLIDDEVVDVHETLDALRVALEAWVAWHTAFDIRETPEDEVRAFKQAIELTKAAGIEWREEEVSK